MDVGEPACMACGHYRESWDRGGVAARWERAELQKAHIIARSADGPDSPGNYVLLCDRCHAAAPMTTKPVDMMAWCDRRQSRRSSDADAMQSEMTNAGITEGDIVMLADLEHQDLNALFQKAVERIGAGLHGSRMSPSTRAAVVVEMARIATRAG